MRGFLLVLPLLACLAALPPTARAAGSARTDAGRIVLTAGQMQAGGIQTAPLRPMRQAPMLRAYGVVLDPGPLAVSTERLAAARAGVTSAEARAAVARAAAARAATLFQAQANISKARYESAEAAARVASANLAAAQARLAAVRARDVADWGRKLASAIAGTRAPLPALMSGRACLIQVTLPLVAALAVPPARADARSAAGAALALRLIGIAPRTQAGGGTSYFYLAPAPACPPAGATLETSMALGAARDGVFVPAAAIVWRDGRPLVFRGDGALGFAPIPLHGAAPVSGAAPLHGVVPLHGPAATNRPSATHEPAATRETSKPASGFFVPLGAGSALKAGQRVVVKGAGLLLSQTEIGSQPKAATASGDDDDD